MALAAQFGGGKKAAPKKAVKKAAAKKAAPVKKPVAKKVVRKAPVRKGEPNIINKLFAMPFIGGGKGVTLGPEYDL